MLLQEWRAVLSTACLVLAYGKFAWPWSGVKVTVFPPDAEWVADEPSAVRGTCNCAPPGGGSNGTDRNKKSEHSPLLLSHTHVCIVHVHPTSYCWTLCDAQR